MSELYLRRTLAGLAATDEAGVEALRKIKQGDIVRCEVTRPRNIQHHRRFFAMLNTVWIACGDWKDTEELLTELKFRVGLVETQRVVDRKTGEVLAELVKPGSISFASMNEDQFSEFYNKCVNVICTDMVPGLSDSVLRDEVLRACA
jgi:hypothetical protein